MTTYDIKRLALVLAVQADIEGMKVENLIRTSNGCLRLTVRTLLIEKQMNLDI